MKPLLRRTFRLYDTHGLPLAVQLDVAKRRDVAVSLPDFYRDAIQAGWSPKRAAGLIEEALVDNGEPRGYVDTALRYLQETTP